MKRFARFIYQSVLPMGPGGKLITGCAAHKKLSKEIAAEGTVLLKNDGILPLKKDIRTIAVIGPNADDQSILLGNYNGTPARYSTLLRGIQDGFDGRVIYARGCHVTKPVQDKDGEHPRNEALIAAKKADVVVLIMGINPTIEGEEGDAYNAAKAGDRTDIELPAVQRELIDAVMTLGKPTVFVNVSGSCMNLEREEKSCNAVLQCFYPGAEGGNALADILFGRVSPSARLPVSFYRSVEDLPAFEDYSMENRTYKFFKGQCVYDFGHGLTYSDVKETYLDENTVELYNAGPYDTDYSVLRFENIPHKCLTAFKCVHIRAGETIKVIM